MTVCAAGPTATAADWLAAIGTVGALLLSLFLVSRDLLDRRRRNQLDERAQASLVRLTKMEIRNGHGGFQGLHQPVQYTCDLINDSGEPIADVTIRLRVELTDPAPEGFEQSLVDEREHERIDAHERHPVSGGVFTTPWDWERGGAAAHIARSSATFTDAAGVRWLRDESGRLRKPPRA